MSYGMPGGYDDWKLRDDGARDAYDPSDNAIFEEADEQGDAILLSEWCRDNGLVLHNGHVITCSAWDAARDRLIERWDNE